MSYKHAPGEMCHCFLPSPCLAAYQINSDHGSLEYKSGDEGNKSLDILDEGEGAEVSISVTGGCHYGTATCPSGYLTDNKEFTEAVLNTDCQVHLLKHHSHDGNRMSLLNAIQHVLAEKKTTSVPYTQYKFCITQCNQKSFTNQILWAGVNTQLFNLGTLKIDSFIHVYPKVTIETDVTLSVKAIKRAIPDDERYKLYQDKAVGNQLDGVAIPTSEIGSTATLEGSVKIAQGKQKTTYGSSIARTQSNIPSTVDHKEVNLQQAFEDIRQQFKPLSAASSMIENIKQGMYQSKGKDKVKVVSFDLIPPKITINGKHTLTMVDSELAADVTTSLGLNPLFGFTMKLDMVLAVAAYYKMETFIQGIRDQAKKLEDKVKAGHAGAYVGAEFDITVSTTLKTDGQITQKPKQAASYALNADTKVTFKAALNARVGAKVWIMEGAFILAAEITAEGTCAIRSTFEEDKPKVEMVFFHEGIKAKVSMTIEVNLVTNEEDEQAGSDGSRASIYNKVANKTGIKETKEQEWIWVKKLTEDDSPYRKVLIGS